MSESDPRIMTEGLVKSAGRTGGFLFRFLKNRRSATQSSSVGCSTRVIFLGPGVLLVMVLSEPYLRLLDWCRYFFPPLVAYNEIAMVELDILRHHWLSLVIVCRHSSSRYSSLSFIQLTY